MQLNETTARIDSQLETVTRKIEKIELDTRGDQEQSNLTFREGYDGKGSKLAIKTIFWARLLTSFVFVSLLRWLRSWLQVGLSEVPD